MDSFRAGSLILALAAFACAGAARAEDYLVSVGLRLRLKPPYEGADSLRVIGVGLLDLQRADKPLRYTAPDAGSVFDLVSSRYVNAGPVISLRDHRTSKGRFAGLKRVSIAVEPGVFFGFWPTEWLNPWVQVRRGVSGHHGWVEDAGVDLIRTGRRWSASFGPRIGFGDGDYMGTYFGVTPEEARISPVVGSPYRPGAGMRYTGASLSAAYRLNRRWTVLADATYERLSGRAQASPIVQELGGGDQLSVGAGFTYTFGRVEF